MYTAIILYIHGVEDNSTGKRLYLSMIRKYIGRIRTDFTDNFPTWERSRMRKQSIPGRLFSHAAWVRDYTLTIIVSFVSTLLSHVCTCHELIFGCWWKFTLHHISNYYTARACAKRLSNWFCPSVSLLVR